MKCSQITFRTALEEDAQTCENRYNIFSNSEQNKVRLSNRTA